MQKTWLFALNGVVLGLIGIGLMPGMDWRTEPILRDGADGSEVALASLETDVARAPTAENAVALARAYLVRKETGLALSVLERFDRTTAPPGDAGAGASVELVRAQAQLASGQTEQALRTVEALNQSCDLDQRAGAACPSWIVAKGAQIEMYAKELTRSGIEDVATDPAGADAAFARSRHQVRLVASN